MKIRKGDTIKIIRGKDRGKKGKVMQVFIKDNRLSIEGLNLKIKHTRPKKEGEKGQTVQFPGPMDIANVMLICPKCNKPTRVGYKKLENKKKIRRCHKCNQVF